MTHRFEKYDHFRIPTLEELVALGWKEDTSASVHLYVYEKYRIVDTMLSQFGGKMVTIAGREPISGYYTIVGDRFHRWPLDAIAELRDIKNHNLYGSICIHEEGSTPLDNWIICRHCGTNLRTLK